MITENQEAKDAKLVQVGPYITREQKERIRKLAYEKRITASEIYRQALDEWFARHA